MPSERISILFNPSAGMGKALLKKAELEERLQSYGILYDLTITENEENLRDLVRMHAATYGTIVGAGGDSTFHIMVNEILKAGAPVSFGMIAVGSSNDIAKEFGVDSLEKACLALRRLKTRKIDVGSIHDGPKLIRYFLGQANIGVGAFVNQYVEGLVQRRSRWGTHQKGAGVLGIIHAYRNKLVPLPLTVESEAGRIDAEFVAAVFSNIRYWATGKIINPNALPDDGRLDACLIEKCSFGRLARISSLANSGRQTKAKEVKFLRSPSFKISSHLPFEIQADGEILKSPGRFPFNEITISNLPQALTIVCEAAPR